MKIGILGYGKMGHEIETAAIEKGHTIGLKINSTNTHLLTKKNIVNIDVAIEFSNPKSAFQNISFCINNQIPVVSGTTGWLDDLPKAKQLCVKKNSAFLYSENFSLGVNIFLKTTEYMAKIIKGEDYQINIVETHHKTKKDSPSGTAILIKDKIAAEIKNKPIEINSNRVSDIKGEHIIKYSSAIDSIQLSHTAHNRIGFAKGSILAAEFIKNKTGFFSMEDVIKTN